MPIEHNRFMTTTLRSGIPTDDERNEARKREAESIRAQAVAIGDHRGFHTKAKGPADPVEGCGYWSMCKSTLTAYGAHLERRVAQLALRERTPDRVCPTCGSPAVHTWTAEDAAFDQADAHHLDVLQRIGWTR